MGLLLPGSQLWQSWCTLLAAASAILSSRRAWEVSCGLSKMANSTSVSCIWNEPLRPCHGSLFISSSSSAFSCLPHSAFSQREKSKQRGRLLAAAAGGVDAVEIAFGQPVGAAAGWDVSEMGGRTDPPASFTLTGSAAEMLTKVQRDLQLHCTAPPCNAWTDIRRAVPQVDAGGCAGCRRLHVRCE